MRKKKHAKHGKVLAKHKPSKKKTKSSGKIKKVLHEFKEGELHGGSKKGPKVKNRKQAIAIAFSEARNAGESVKPKKKGK